MFGWVRRVLFDGGQGPGSNEAQAFTELVASRMRTEIPSLQVEIQAPLMLMLSGPILANPIPVGLTKVYSGVASKSVAARQRTAEEFVAFVGLRILSERHIGFDADRLLPVLRSADSLEAQVGAEKYPRRMFAETVPIFLVLDLPAAMASVDRSMLTEAGLTEDAAFAKALANLAARPFEIEWVKPGAVGTIVKAGDYESSHILNDVLWQELDRSYGGEWLATILARDLLFFAKNLDSDDARLLLAAVGGPLPGVTHPITKWAFIRRNGEWTRSVDVQSTGE